VDGVVATGWGLGHGHHKTVGHCGIWTVLEGSCSSGPCFMSREYMFGKNWAALSE
jgi:hypothetical protein